MKKLLKFFLAIGLLGLVATAAIWVLNIRGEVDVSAPVASAAPSEGLVARGAYLARAGNCMACHTVRGGASYAGGRGIDTPFGVVFTSNLTPDDKTGIGTWSSAHFWRAMHNGRSKTGRLLYPAFPYTSYTQVTREDSDALFAFLKSLPAVASPNKAHALQFPYQSQAALAVWRALYFKPSSYKPDSSRSAEWNRGAYLVNGLGHCAACHTARNKLGGFEGVAFAGGLIPKLNWYAPSLISAREGGVGTGSQQEMMNLLQTGVSKHASVSGPMAEVVLGSTQYLNQKDLSAMALFLKELPETSAIPFASGKPAEPDIEVMSGSPAGQPIAVSPALAARGAKLYEQHCAQCHGDSGKGVVNAYPALAENRAVTMSQTANLVQIVLNGGFAPATAGNPRPFGMPPFVLLMDDSDVAAVLTHIRTNWGNNASVVSPLEVNRIRANRGN
ncbi:MAG: cytochrome c [Pseudomonadota bacterium]